MLKKIIVLMYLLGALLVWIDFRSSPPDGLANVGIGLYTLPVFLLTRLFGVGEFPFFDGDYYTAHTKYFVVSVPVISVMIYSAVLALERAVDRHKRKRT